MTKLKAFADDKLNVAKMTIFLYDRVENMVEKGGNAYYMHFLLFPQFFLIFICTVRKKKKNNNNNLAPVTKWLKMNDHTTRAGIVLVQSRLNE